MALHACCVCLQPSDALSGGAACWGFTCHSSVDRSAQVLPLSCCLVALAQVEPFLFQLCLLSPLFLVALLYPDATMVCHASPSSTCLLLSFSLMPGCEHCCYAPLLCGCGFLIPPQDCSYLLEPGPQFTTGGERAEQSWRGAAEMFRWFLDIRYFDNNSSLRKNFKTAWPEAETSNLNH